MNGLDILYTACCNEELQCINCPMYIYAIQHNIDPRLDCKELYELMVYGRITTLTSL